MKRNISLLLCMCLLLCSLLSACGPSQPFSEDTTIEDTSTELDMGTESETESESDTTVTVVIPDGEVPNITELFDDEQHSLSDSVFSFMENTPYGFCDKAQCLADLPTATYSDTCYVDAALLADMLGLTYRAEGDALTLSILDATMTFAAGKAEVAVTVADETTAYPFPTVIKKTDGFSLSATHLGQMLGYASLSVDGLTLIAKQEHLNQDAADACMERFGLYESVIYNYDDVECDQIGVGRYDATPHEDRLVGVAYSAWHTPKHDWWGSETWDLPLCGSYFSNDEDVIRYHGELLRDANVDFVFIDWSNNTVFDRATMSQTIPNNWQMIEEATDLIFDIWATIEGAPKICIFVGPGHTGQESITDGRHQSKVDQVWRDYVTNPARSDMYFHYEGKPLLICYGATPTQYEASPQALWDDDRFTVRWVTGYVSQQPGLYDVRSLRSHCYWSWEERGAQTFTVLNDRVEAVTVTASWRPQGEPGEDGAIPAGLRDNGSTLKMQFQRACDLGAGMVLVVSWNEWILGEQISVEMSKDIEPSQIHGTFYYDLMREQIKKFKGQV